MKNKNKKKNIFVKIVIILLIICAIIFGFLFSYNKYDIVKDNTPSLIEDIIKIIPEKFFKEKKMKDVPKYESIESGVYFDRLSKRAVMEVNYTDDGVYHFEINWGNSAEENTRWTFSGHLEKFTNIIHYTDSRCVLEMYYDGENHEAEVYTDGEGIIKYDGNVLYWVDVNEQRDYDNNYNGIFELPIENVETIESEEENDD